MKITLPVAIATGAAIAFVGGGVALGLGMQGSHPASPVTVQQVDQQVTTSADAGTSAVAPSPSGPASVTVALTPAAPTSAAPVMKATVAKVTHADASTASSGGTQPPDIGVQTFVPFDPTAVGPPISDWTPSTDVKAPPEIPRPTPPAASNMP